MFWPVIISASSSGLYRSVIVKPREGVNLMRMGERPTLIFVPEEYFSSTKKEVQMIPQINITHIEMVNGTFRFTSISQYSRIDISPHLDETNFSLPNAFSLS